MFEIKRKVTVFLMTLLLIPKGLADNYLINLIPEYEGATIWKTTGILSSFFNSQAYPYILEYREQLYPLIKIEVIQQSQSILNLVYPAGFPTAPNVAILISRLNSLFERNYNDLLLMINHLMPIAHSNDYNKPAIWTSAPYHPRGGGGNGRNEEY
ncbi:hypothetical protein [Endozoicomonas sp. Mp262]|uniref:hypothetical protein n=1 Tax=Endozoicomonas sp. Mp262 TaxID=2919499 RepID=UPI0021D9F054